MMRRSSWDARLDKRVNIEKLEEQGLIADSMEVRKGLVERVMRGEITPEQSREELKRIQRNAKHNGLKTRNQAWREG
ncbi:hypothetical protein [Citrobacter amalonaticus]|uniref:hypothetical protein n=1 Tax=Citrobacter amalonaticus TaxID=35703 RepID=UPI000621339B|nr:hypothetical protein [Citrobacter amalonaticus]KKF68303.1 hypothetical protein XU19_18010 [Vibrio parahaemolyticus]KKY40137.1 hypothetical protein AAY51_23165 [Vibrio parahaemolyticus]KOP97020.1 hypothetical protein AL012_06725 [Citrobacter amalonaticus]KOP98406.1 hypothetical protein ALC61_09880 [Citrobacter amalonaticus]